MLTEILIESLIAVLDILVFMWYNPLPLLVGYIRGFVGSYYSRAASVGTFSEIILGAGSYFIVDAIIVIKFIMGNEPRVYIVFCIGAFLGGVCAWMFNNRKKFISNIKKLRWFK